MDISYLLFLQKFREMSEKVLAPFMDWITKLSISFVPFAILIMIYWVFDRKNGRKMLAGLSLSYLMNGFLKLTCCVYRPWIRDSRIEPYGDAKVAATGYSFPSGHTTVATATYGNEAILFWDKKKSLSWLLILLIALTMFSRNYLGVHTPQDVVVGLLASLLMLWIGRKIDDWTDADPDRRDKIVLILGIVVCVILALYYIFKPYPLDYTSDGQLLVDPVKMLPDSFQGLGSFSGFVIFRYLERRGYAFDKELHWKDRFIIGIFALIPLYFFDTYIVDIFVVLGSKCLGKFLLEFENMAYVLYIVPCFMKKVKEKNG